jgi:GNAT superfamily N-acetyltransferase
MATAGDAEVITEFNLRLARQTEARELVPGCVADGVAALLADPAKGRYHVAEHDGQVIGQLLITYEWSDWRNGWFWWIQSVFVKEEFRGRGMFRSLFAHIQRLARESRDVCGLRLYVERDNEAARASYESLGMNLTSYRLYEIEFSRGEEPIRPATSAPRAN